MWHLFAEIFVIYSGYKFIENIYVPVLLNELSKLLYSMLCFKFVISFKCPELQHCLETRKVSKYSERLEKLAYA
jgi:hypothetical protein